MSEEKRLFNPIHDVVVGKKENERMIKFEHWKCILQFLLDLPAKQPFCNSRTGKTGTLTCSCLAVFGNQSAAKAVAAYLTDFSRLKKIDRQRIVTEWIRYSSIMSRNKAVKPHHLPFKDYQEYQQ
jgi:hypothetical protein